MKIFLLKISNNEIIPDKNFADYSIFCKVHCPQPAHLDIFIIYIFPLMKANQDGVHMLKL